MSIKKILMLASMALAAIAFAAPASALAAEGGELYDVDTEHTVTQGETLELTGEAEFTAFGSGIRCVVHVPLEAQAASKLTVEEFIITPKTCVGSGVYEGCEVVEPESTTPWNVTVTTTDFDIKEIGIFSGLAGAECLFTFSALEFGEVTGTPLDENTQVASATEPIHGVALDGEGENCNDFGCLNVEAHGHLDIVGEDTGTYAFKH